MCQIDTPSTERATWAGWYRPSRAAPWVRLADAEDYSDCWGRLLERLPDGPGGESIVLAAELLPTGRVSTDRRPR